MASKKTQIPAFSTTEVLAGLQELFETLASEHSSGRWEDRWKYLSDYVAIYQTQISFERECPGDSFRTAMIVGEAPLTEADRLNIRKAAAIKKQIVAQLRRLGDIE